jgi:hypothetical protein
MSHAHRGAGAGEGRVRHCASTRGWLLVAISSALLAGCGGKQPLCEPDPSYAGRQDGRALSVPDGMTPPRTTGRFDIPSIVEASGEVDPRCTAYPPRIAGVETSNPRGGRQREAARQREQEAAAAAAIAAAAAGPTRNPRTVPDPPSTAGEPVAIENALFIEVYDAVAAWSAAWSERRFDDYIAGYSADYRPPRPMNRAQWEATRASRMEEGAQAVVQLDTLEVFQGEEGPIARFVQAFSFEGIESDITKELLLAREGDEWRILEERVIDVR